jgi:hypothetical protein
MRMNMFAVWEEVKPDIENKRGLNLAEVKLNDRSSNKTAVAA